MPRFSRLTLIAAALLLCVAPARAAPGDDIGATVRIVNLVTGAYAEDRRNLATGDPVRQDELIEVSRDGIGEIRLNDDTELALGPGARLKLDQFVYDPDISGGAIVVDLVEGAFRFITGIAAKPAYVIRTPTASITVRGTIFDVYVEPVNGISWLLLLEGAIEACSEPSRCKTLDEPGKLIRITPDGVVGDPRIWADLPTGGLTFATAFPFVVAPPQVDPDPVFTPAEIVDGRIPDGPIYDEDDDDDARPGDTGDDGSDAGRPGLPPLDCWSGWRRVHRGWREDGWYVKRRYQGGRVIHCAHRRAAPPPVIGLPPRPQCDGGRTVLLKTLPPRWRCICRDGAKRHRVGPNAYVCRGRPDGPGGSGPGGPGDGKKQCLKKGWYWIGGKCLPRVGKCKPGYAGKWPNCKRISEPGKSCPKGTLGKWPICKRQHVDPPRKHCPKGTFGKWPDCRKKSGQTNPRKPAGDLKRALKNFKQQQQQKKNGN